MAPTTSVRTCRVAVIFCRGICVCPHVLEHCVHHDHPRDLSVVVLQKQHLGVDVVLDRESGLCIFHTRQLSQADGVVSDVTLSVLWFKGNVANTCHTCDSMKIVRPMLACPPGPAGLPDGAFPLLATPKIDGIRALKINGKVVSRTLKQIPNVRLRDALEAALPEGSDGEITFGNTFQESTSAVMTRDGPMSGFTFSMFDFVSGSPDVPYADRMDEMRLVMEKRAQMKLTESVASIVSIEPLFPVQMDTIDELDVFEEEALAAGFEGVMVRAPSGRYKFGRSTAREGLLLKIKRFQDAEAIVITSEELMHKDGGHGGTLGSLSVRGAGGVEFSIGTGFSATQRKDLWAARKQLVGQMVKYKYFAVGTKSAPRFPVFIGFRHADDVSA